jgi:hypothetical protein
MCTCKMSGYHPVTLTCKALFYVGDSIMGNKSVEHFVTEAVSFLPIAVDTLLTLPHANSILKSLRTCIVIIA